MTLNVDRNSPTGSFNLILQASFDQNLLTSVNIPYNVITLQPDGIVSVNELTGFFILLLIFTLKLKTTKSSNKHLTEISQLIEDKLL